MKVLCVHPSGLMYTEIFLRLEPLGLEVVAEACRVAGHQVQLIDLQAEPAENFAKLVKSWQPDVIALACNYLANVPEVVDLGKAARALLPNAFILIGGHSASFVARDMLEHADGAIDCVLKGEGEAAIALLINHAMDDRSSITDVPGVVTLDGEGPKPGFVESLDDIMPARDLLKHRRRYFIGMLDPAASIEFSRGCPWDCQFCSAWTFYGRSYRTVSPERAVEDLERIQQSGVFIVDDVAFIQSQHGLAIGEAIAKKGIKKKYYMETRGDVLLRNKEVFKFWRDLGVEYMFLGLEAIDDEGLKRFRKRADLGSNFEALEYARSLGLQVAVNLIADPDWDHERFEVIRQWCLEVPEVVNISVNTPYPGTETWLTEGHKVTNLDYRLYDIQHCVLPTKMSLEEFYRELVKTQQVMNMKHLGWNTLMRMSSTVAGHLMNGQTNFLRMLWKFNSVYNPDRLIADHQRPAKYLMKAAPAPVGVQDTKKAAKELYIHKAKKRPKRAIDKDTEAFVEATRFG